MEPPFTVAPSRPLLPSLLNVTVALPTAVRWTCDGLNGTALKAGPVVRSSSPENVLAAVRRPFDITSQSGEPSMSYVNQVAKTTSPCCAKLMPHPDSLAPGEAHHSPCTFTPATGCGGGGGCVGGGGGGAAPPSSIVTWGPTT